MLDPIVQAALVVLVAALLKWLVSFLPFQFPISDEVFNAIAGAIVTWLLSQFFLRGSARLLAKTRFAGLLKGE